MNKEIRGSTSGSQKGEKGNKKKNDLKGLITQFYESQFTLFSIWNGKELEILNCFGIIISYIQILSLSLTTGNNLQNSSLLLRTIFYVARPSAYLAQGDETMYGQALGLCWGCLVSMLLFHVLVKKELYRPLVNYGLTFFNSFFYVIFLEVGYSQILPNFITANATSFSSFSTSESLGRYTSSTLRGVIGIFLIIFTQFSSTFITGFCETNTSLYEIGLSRLSISKSYKMSVLVKHFLVAVIYIEFDQKESSAIFQLALAGVYSILSFYDLAKHVPFSSHLKILQSGCGLMILTLGLIFLSALQNCFELISSTTALIFFLICLPPGIKFACQLSEDFFFKLIYVSWINNSVNTENEGEDMFSEIEDDEFSNNFLSSDSEKNAKSNGYQESIYNDTFYFAHQLAFFSRNRLSLLKNKKNKLFLLSAFQSHIYRCKNELCDCRVKTRIIGVQEGRFYLNPELLCSLLQRKCHQLLITKSYLGTPSYQQAFFSMINFMISLKRNIFSLQRVIELLVDKSTLDLSLGNQKIERGIWFRSGLSVFLKIIQKSIDLSFLQPLIIFGGKLGWSKRDLDKNKDVYNTFLACSLFFQVEEIKNENLKHVIQIVKLKIEALKKIKSGIKNMQEIKKINEDFQSKIEKCERNLTEFYEKVPTRDNQSILCFFLSEIKSDLKRSQEIMGKRQFSNSLDMNLLLGTNTIMQIFSNSVHSLRVSYSKGSGDLLWYSNSLPKFLGYSKQEFVYFQKLNDILPHVLAFYHDDLVMEYLKEGDNSKIFQELKQGYLRHQMGWIQPVQMFININFMDLSQIGFFVFFQKQSHLQSTYDYILLDEDGFMESTSFGILERAGLQRLPFDITLGTLHADKLIEDFDKAFKEIKRLTTITKVDHRDVTFSIPNIKYFQDSFNMIEKGYSTSATSIFNSKRVNYSKRIPFSLLVLDQMSNKSQNLFVEFQMDYSIEKIHRKFKQKDAKYFIITVKKLIEVSNDDSQIGQNLNNQTLDGSMAALGLRMTNQSSNEKILQVEEENQDIFKKLNENKEQAEVTKPNLANPFFKYRNLILQKAKQIEERDAINIPNSKDEKTLGALSPEKTIGSISPDAHKKFTYDDNKTQMTQKSNRKNLLTRKKTVNMFEETDNDLQSQKEQDPDENTKASKSGARQRIARPTRSYKRSTIIQSSKEGDQVKLFRLRETSKKYSKIGAGIERQNTLNKLNMTESQNKLSQGQITQAATLNPKIEIQNSKDISSKSKIFTSEQVPILEEEGTQSSLIQQNEKKQNISTSRNHDVSVVLSTVRNESDMLFATRRDDVFPTSDRSFIEEKSTKSESKNISRSKPNDVQKQLSNQTVAEAKAPSIAPESKGIDILLPIEFSFKDKNESTQKNYKDTTSKSSEILWQKISEDDSQKKSSKKAPIKSITKGGTKSISTPKSKRSSKHRRNSVPNCFSDVQRHIQYQKVNSKGIIKMTSSGRRRAFKSLTVQPTQLEFVRKDGHFSDKKAYTMPDKSDKLISEESESISIQRPKLKKDTSKSSYTKNANSFLKQLKDIQFMSQKKGNHSPLKESEEIEKQKTIDSFSSHRKEEEEPSRALFKEKEGGQNNILPVTKENNQAKVKAKEQQMEKNDQQSVASSLQKSIFSNKYDNFTKFISKNDPPDLQKLRVSKLAEFFMIFFVCFFSSISIYQNFSKFNSDLKIMKIRNNSILPLSNTATLLFSQKYNDDLLISGDITLAAHTSTTTLISAYMAESYELYSNWLNENLNEYSLRAVYLENELEITSFSSQAQVTMSLLRCGLLQKRVLLVLHQNIQEQIAFPLVTFSSEEATFIKNNFYCIFNFFVKLSEQLTSEVKNTTLNVESYFVMEVLFVVLGYTIMQAIQFYYYRQYTILVRHILRLFETTTMPQIDSEINRLFSIQTLTEGEDSYLVFCYDFDLRAKEIALRKESKILLEQEEKHHLSVQQKQNFLSQINKNNKVNTIPQLDMFSKDEEEPLQIDNQFQLNIKANNKPNGNQQTLANKNQNQGSYHSNQKGFNFHAEKENPKQINIQKFQQNNSPINENVNNVPMNNNNKQVNSKVGVVLNSKVTSAQSKKSQIAATMNTTNNTNGNHLKSNGLNQNNDNNNESDQRKSKIGKSQTKSSKKNSKKNNQQSKRNRKNFRIESGKISFSSFLQFFSLLSFPLIIYFVCSFLLTYEYINNFTVVISSYHRFQDASSYLQSGYVLSNQVIAYVPPALRQQSDIYNSLKSSINESSHFTSTNMLDLVNTISKINSNLQSQVHTLLTDSACDSTILIDTALEQNLKNDVMQRCFHSDRGILNIGIAPFFSNVLKDLSDLVELDFGSNSASRQDDEDAETNIGLLIIFSGKIISYCSDLVRETLLNKTELYQYLLLSINIIFLVFTFIIYIHQLYFKHKNLILEFKRSQHIIFLLPSITLLTDETFFKQINYLNIKVHQT